MVGRGRSLPWPDRDDPRALGRRRAGVSLRVAAARVVVRRRVHPGQPQRPRRNAAPPRRPR